MKELCLPDKNYLGKFLSGQRDSNSQLSDWKSDTLPIELYPQYVIDLIYNNNE